MWKFHLTVLVLLLCGEAHAVASREAFLAAVKARYGAHQIDEAILSELRKGAADINKSAPNDVGGGLMLTSASVNKAGVMTYRYTMTGMTSKNIDANLAAKSLHDLFVSVACKDEVMRKGIDAGASIHPFLTTIDGQDIDVKVISAASCKGIR